jgi:hypothetical protein
MILQGRSAGVGGLIVGSCPLPQLVGIDLKTLVTHGHHRTPSFASRSAII